MVSNSLLPSFEPITNYASTVIYNNILGKMSSPDYVNVPQEQVVQGKFLSRLLD